MDHFVHRFTHRVARGLLIAVGRPDGRLCCLAKSEAAILLSAKQVCVCVCLCLFMCVSVFLLSDGLKLECFRCLAITLPVSSISFSSLSMITYDLEALMIPLTSRLLLLSHLCDHHLNFYLYPFFPSLPLLLPPSSRPPSDRKSVV